MVVRIEGEFPKTGNKKKIENQERNAKLKSGNGQRLLHCAKRALLWARNSVQVGYGGGARWERGAGSGGGKWYWTRDGHVDLLGFSLGFGSAGPAIA